MSGSKQCSVGSCSSCQLALTPEGHSRPAHPLLVWLLGLPLLVLAKWGAGPGWTQKGMLICLYVE